jgi:tetratricopeptide (TPR) repeat protein
MDSTARMAIIDGIIKSLEEEDRKREQEEREMERNVMMSNQFVDRTANLNQSAEWYFYNPNTLSFGYTEFLRKWGRRKLEDNWRISDKQSISFETIDGVVTDGASGGGATEDSTANFTDRDRGYYLRDIPLTEEAKVEAIKEVEDAYNGLGYTYKERLGDFPRSIEAYAKLNERFPESEYRLQSWYAQFRMHEQMGNVDEAERFKRLILSEYPNSDYARVIEDPEYFIKKAQVASESTAFYEQTLEAYKNEEFFRVLLNANRAHTLYPDDVDLIPRFDFLRAVAKGRLETIDSMAVALEKLVKTYPTNPVAPTAAAILRNMNKEYNMNIDIPKIAGDTLAEKDEKESPYVFAEQSLHLVMIVASSEKVRTDPLKVRLSDFNTREYKSAQLMIKSLVLDDLRTLITVGNFETATAALDYRNALMGSDYVLGGISPTDFTTAPISLTNYPTFYRIKDLNEYETFWKKTYTK